MSSWSPKLGASNAGGSRGSLALDMTEDAVVLCRCQRDGSVEEIARAVLEAPDFSAQIQALQNEASRQDPARRPVTLWLPEAQILLRKMSLGSKQRSPALAEAALRLQSETEHRADELSIDVSISKDDSPSVVIAALVQTVREAKEYAAKWGFVPGPVSTRCHLEAFGDRPPVFALPGKTAESTKGRFLRLAAASVVLAGAGVGGWVYYDSVSQRAPSLVIHEVAGSNAQTFQNADMSPGAGRLALTAVRREDADLGEAHPAVSLDRNERIGRHSASPPAKIHEMSEMLAVPAAPAQLAIGAEPVLPSHDVPGSLFAPASASGGVGITEAREAIDQIRVQSLGLSEPTASADGRQLGQTAHAITADGRFQNVNATEPGAVLDDDWIVATIGTSATIAAANGSSGEPQSVQELQPAQSAGEAEPDEVAAADPNLPHVPKPKPSPLTEPVQEAEPAVAEDTESDVAAAPDPNSDDQDAAPETSEEIEETSGDSDETLAALTSPTPVERPEHLSAPESQVASKKTKAKPAEAGPSPASVSAAAAESGLQLDETSLIGVIDASTGRTALVRLPDGDFRKIARGDVLDGWVVSSIGRDRMKLTRQGRNRTLDLVSQ